jgi:hypothetical protein
MDSNNKTILLPKIAIKSLKSPILLSKYIVNGNFRKRRCDTLPNIRIHVRICSSRFLYFAIGSVWIPRIHGLSATPKQEIISHVPSTFFGDVDGFYFNVDTFLHQRTPSFGLALAYCDCSFTNANTKDLDSDDHDHHRKKDFVRAICNFYMAYCRFLDRLFVSFFFWEILFLHCWRLFILSIIARLVLF